MDQLFAKGREDTAIMKVTIVFRGLMVLHKQGDTMEIGFVDALYKPTEEHVHDGDAVDHPDHPPTHAPVHVPRILTTKDGVLSSIFDLRNRPELGPVRNWSLVVDKPATTDTPVRLFQPDPSGEDPSGETTIDAFNRKIEGPGQNSERDFRWITDLEASDFHNRDLSLEINTRQFLLVLYVRQGEFYTRLRSPKLQQRRLTPTRMAPYGRTAAVVGCDITFDIGGGVKLMAGGSRGARVFDFTPDDGTIYEISNGPPDVPAEGPTDPDEPGHFHMYYDKLFKSPRREQFDLVTDDLAPAPDPTLCGVVYLGQRQDPL
jgi:hypothetical protein